MNRGSLAHWRSEIDRGLEAACADLLPTDEIVGNAARYVLLSGGKRLRGLLSLSVAADLGELSAREPLGLNIAVALEILHAASLVHDDLPALDNDDHRRGKPSCHRAFSESTAILVGDLLVGMAFSIVTQSEIPDATKVVVMRSLSDAWIKLCRGQVKDIEVGGKAVPREVMELKTGALFAASVVSGVAVSGNTVDTSAWEQWGRELGVLFQRVDDLLDGEGGGNDVEQLQVDLSAQLITLRRSLLGVFPAKSVMIEQTLSLFIPSDLQHLLDQRS